MPGSCPPDPREDPQVAYVDPRVDPLRAYLDLFDAVDRALARGDIVGARAALEQRRELAEQLRLELAATEPP